MKSLKKYEIFRKLSALRRIGILYVRHRIGLIFSKGNSGTRAMTIKDLEAISELEKPYESFWKIPQYAISTVIDCLYDQALIIDFHDETTPSAPVLMKLDKEDLISKTKGISWSDGKAIDIMIFYSTVDRRPESSLYAVVLEYSLSGTVSEKLRDSLMVLKRNLELAIDNKMIEIGKLSERLETLEKII